MINNVVLMGRLTYQPEVKSTPSGVAVVRFQIACDRNYQKQGEERKADFIDVTAWRQTAEFISRYFHKGSMIAVQGSIQTDNYTDKDGNKRKSVDVVANQVSFCGAKKDGQAPAYADKPIVQEQYSNANTSNFEDLAEDDEELPF